jgi:vacuolar-type H+-ATPase subunit E/Vma4
MPESIESFVKKLQSEGVDAGKEAAEKIKREAKREAEKILGDAKAEAEKILAKAKSDADKKLSRGQTELELAVRDAILKLNESLGRVLSAMLTQRVEKKLSDPDYLGEIMREVITAYAKADAGQLPLVEVNVSKKMGDKLNDHVLKDLFQNLSEEQDKMALRATLTKAGFEYKIHGATVEVSPDSVSELLAEMVSPALKEIFDKFIDKKGEKSSNAERSIRGEKKAHAGQDRSDGGERTSKGDKH